MLGEQSGEMSCADTDSRGERLDIRAIVVERTRLDNQSSGTFRRDAAAAPCRTERSRLRSAPQARAESGCFGGSRTRSQIEALIEATHYPYKIGSDKLDLLGQIIRDADLAQALSPAWIQQVVFGLAQEWEVSPLEVLKGQLSFLAGLSFSTCWAQQLFPQELIQAKIEEVEQLLRLLETAPASAAAD